MALTPEKESPPVPLSPEALVLGTLSEGITKATDTAHHVQCWKVEPAYARPGRWSLRMKHVAAGARGAFHLVAWSDTDDDGRPDTELGRSELLVAARPEAWSAWEFRATAAPLFVGNAWPQEDEVVFYRLGGTRPRGYVGLGETVYFSRRFDGTPNGRARPRFTNLRLRFLGR